VRAGCAEGSEAAALAFNVYNAIARDGMMDNNLFSFTFCPVVEHGGSRELLVVEVDRRYHEVQESDIE